MIQSWGSLRLFRGVINLPGLMGLVTDRTGFGGAYYKQRSIGTIPKRSSQTFITEHYGDIEGELRIGGLGSVCFFKRATGALCRFRGFGAECWDRTVSSSGFTAYGFRVFGLRQLSPGFLGLGGCIPTAASETWRVQGFWV